MNKAKKIMLSIVALMCMAGIALSVCKGNIPAVCAWVTSTIMTIGWLGQIIAMDNAVEDSKFWKRNFQTAQERYARCVHSVSDETIEGR